MEAIKILTVFIVCVVHVMCSRWVNIDFCTKAFPKTELTLEYSVNRLKDFKEKLDLSTNNHTSKCGYQEDVIMHEGIEDFYKSKQDTKRLRLPRKRRTRVANEIQWTLTAVAYNLNSFSQFIQLPSHTPSDFNRENKKIFSRLAMEANKIGHEWAITMSNLKLYSKKRKTSCYRQGCIPENLPSTEKYVCKKGAMLLRDVKCSVEHLIDFLADCRIKNNKRSRKSKRRNRSPRLHCSKTKRTVFYNTRRRGTAKRPNCLMPKKRLHLWDS